MDPSIYYFLLVLSWVVMAARLTRWTIRPSPKQSFPALLAELQDIPKPDEIYNLSGMFSV